jgi:hypothetical protein
MPAYGYLLGLTVLTALVSVLFVWALLRLARLLRRRNRTEDRAPRCGRCGYNLTDVALPRCPECGCAIGFDRTLAELGIEEAEAERHAQQRRRELNGNPVAERLLAGRQAAESESPGAR